MLLYWISFKQIVVKLQVYRTQFDKKIIKIIIGGVILRGVSTAGWTDNETVRTEMARRVIIVQNVFGCKTVFVLRLLITNSMRLK